MSYCLREGGGRVLREDGSALLREEFDSLPVIEAGGGGWSLEAWNEIRREKARRKRKELGRQAEPVAAHLPRRIATLSETETMRRLASIASQRLALRDRDRKRRDELELEEVRLVLHLLEMLGLIAA